MPEKVTLRRNSVAYRSDGVSMRAHQARFDTGKYGQGLLIEEGATNLLTVNQSTVETDITGFVAVSGATLTRVLAEHWEGLAALKVETGTSASAGVFVSAATSTQETYSAGCRIKNASGATVSAFVQIVYTDASTTNGVATTIPSGSAVWVEVRTASAVSNGAKTVSSVGLRITRLTGTTNTIFYVDAMSVQVGEATSWQVSGTPRLAERYTVPTRNVLIGNEGTIECWVYLTAAHGTARRHVIDARHPTLASSSNRGIALRIETTGLAQSLLGQGSSTLALTSTTVLSVGVWYHLAVRWQANNYALFVNGVKEALSGATAVDLLLSPQIFIGGGFSTTAVVQPLNGILDDVRFSRTARTDAQIAATAASTSPLAVDIATTLLLPFDGGTRGMLPANVFSWAREEELLAFTATASTAATNYPASNVANVEHPFRPHRSTNLTLTTITCDLGADAQNVAALAIQGTNYELVDIDYSQDNITYTMVGDVTAALAQDGVDGLRKYGVRAAFPARYVRFSILAQVTDSNVSFFETCSILIASDMNALPWNPQSPMRLTAPERAQFTNEAGGHFEASPGGPGFIRMEWSVMLRATQIEELRALGLLALGKKVLIFLNLGKSEEVYLMTPDAVTTYEHGGTTYTSSLSWRQHV